MISLTKKVFIIFILFIQAPGFALDLIAHRGGGEGVLKPSSLAAFQYSLQNGINILESDLHLTKDQRIVLAHDPILLGNQSLIISQMNLVDVLKIEELVTLEQIYELYLSNPDLTFQFEIKYLNPWDKRKNNLYISKTDLVQNMIHQIESLGLEKAVTLASFDEEILLIIRKLNPRIALKYNYRGIYFGNYLGNISLCQKYCFWPKWDKAIQFTNDNRIEIFAPSFLLLTHPVMKKLNPVSKVIMKTSNENLGFKIHVWTVNNLTDLQKLKDFKVDAIITDYPVMFKNEFKQEFTKP